MKNTINLLQIMREFGVNKFILSSTAAVYGNHEKGSYYRRPGIKAD